MKVVLNISPNNSNRTFMDNMYQYDILSNVLSVENTAALPTTGQIGGSVLYEYGYDDLNRLVTAEGSFTGRNAADTGNEYQRYTLAMSYDNMHNILSKNQIHETSPDETEWTKAHQTTYDLTYEEYNTAEYNVAGYSYTQPHAVRQVIDKPEATSTGNDVKSKLYDYDANGNLTNITQTTGESETVEKLRTNLWDEENRLRAVDITPDAEGIRPIAIYTYDAGGERILKHSNTSVSIYLNGKKVADTIQVDATLYPSGITVFRPSFGGEGGGSYTKHYFAGTQRVSSKIGTTENLGDYLYDWFTQGTGGPIDVIGSSFGVLENAEEGVVQVYTELGIEPPVYDSDPVFIPVQSFVHGGSELEQYYFHPDHLGSTSYITNLLGEVSQHMEYFAFGETFVEEHRSSNNSPYKFNGKELDEETGLYYYGARYYDPRISVWISVDQMWERHPTKSPYVYVLNNPIALIDPDGNQEFPSYAAYKSAMGKNALSRKDMWKQGHWLARDRENFSLAGFTWKGNQDIFRKANVVNLKANASGEYVNLLQRGAFYDWAGDYASSKGHQVKWLDAADKTVGNLFYLLSFGADLFGRSNSEIRDFVEKGNKAILDHMMPEINDLIFGDKLTGDAAKKWDAQMLSNEQSLIQPYYENLSPESIKLLDSNLKLIYGDKWEGKDLLNPADRWQFGMGSMGYDVKTEDMPDPNR